MDIELVWSSNFSSFTEWDQPGRHSSCSVIEWFAFRAPFSWRWRLLVSAEQQTPPLPRPPRAGRMAEMTCEVPLKTMGVFCVWFSFCHCFHTRTFQFSDFSTLNMEFLSKHFFFFPQNKKRLFLPLSMCFGRPFPEGISFHPLILVMSPILPSLRDTCGILFTSC